jgi:phenylacetate-CoA ligase
MGSRRRCPRTHQAGRGANLTSGGFSPAAWSRLTRAEIDDAQREKLKSLAGAIFGHNAFYTSRFESAGVGPGDFSEPDVIRRLPFVTKEDLAADQAQSPPYGTLLTYPADRYVRLHQTSGTTGQPMRWLDTPESWDWIMRLWAMIFEGAKLGAGQRLFFPFSFGPFLGFWGAFDAAHRCGHLALPGGAMTTPARLHFMMENVATVVACTPTYALHMAEVAVAEGLDLAGSSVHSLIVAGEPGGSIPEVRARIEQAWGARVFDHTGMTELGPLGFECAENPGGMHVMEPEFIAEVIDPESGASCEPGQRGELIVTNLGRWGSPLIRYRTGDLVCADAEPCPCGRQSLRLRGGILGRLDSMVYIRGNNLYPAALEGVIRKFGEIAEYRAEVSSESGMAVLTLTVETVNEFGSNEDSLAERIASEVKERFHFRPRVRLVEAGTLPRFELKASRFLIHPSYRKESV